MREYMTQIGGIERVGVNNQQVPDNQQLLADISPGRTVTDAEAIERYVPGISAVTPISELNAAVSQGGNTVRSQVSGCWPDFVPINKHEIDEPWLSEVERRHNLFPDMDYKLYA